MKKLFVLVAAVIALSTSCNNPASTNEAKKTDSVSFQSIDTTKLSAGSEFYQCPMHLENISDMPGACPTCEMDLEKRVKS